MVKRYKRNKTLKYSNIGIEDLKAKTSYICGCIFDKGCHKQKNWTTGRKKIKKFYIHTGTFSSWTSFYLHSLFQLFCWIYNPIVTLLLMLSPPFDHNYIQSFLHDISGPFPRSMYFVFLFPQNFTEMLDQDS